MCAIPDHEQRLAALEAAAPDIASAFGMEVIGVWRLPSLTRAVFALETGEGRHVLRLHPGDARSDELQSLLRWLEALSGACLPVPRPRATLRGEWLAEVALEGLPGPQRCSLLSWLPGKALTPEELTSEHAWAMGNLLARLHDFALRWQAPPGFVRPSLDADGLFGEDSPYASPGSEEYFSPELREAMHLVELRTRAQCHRLRGQPGAWGLVHGDLIAKNCLFGDDGASALDFDNCAWGCFLYDLAPATLQFTGLPGGEALARALWSGYTARRSLSPARRYDLETLVAARLVASCRWLVANRHAPVVRDRLETLLAQRSLTLRDYLGSGFVRRRSEML
ncbi:MAG: phosphotransferase [Anaerolineae bacterium]|nr:phosphotransferase [Anaerolineae bacterium]